MYTDHAITTLTLPTTVYIISILFLFFFPNFLAIFALITIFGNVHRLYKRYANIVNNSVYYFSSFFPDLVTIFALVTLFRNVHRPCKHYFDIVNNSLHHVYSFFLFFSNFLAIFALVYLEMCTNHVNSTPALSTTVYILSIFSPFSGYIYIDYLIFGNAHGPCK